MACFGCFNSSDFDNLLEKLASELSDEEDSQDSQNSDEAEFFANWNDTNYFSDDAFNSDIIAESVENIKKSKRPSSPRRKPVPRLLLRDKRRFYVDMCANVFNANDYHLLYGMFNMYCIPNVQQNTYQLHAMTSTVDNQTTTIETHYIGVPSVAKFWYTLFQLGPDALVRITDKQIFISPETNHSKITTKYVFTATKHLEIHNNNTILTNVDTTISNETPVSKRRLIRTITNSNPEKTLQTKTLTILEEPVQIIVEGTFTLYTDGNKHIYRLEMESLPPKIVKIEKEML
jgi:hypothetical protein